MNPYDIAIVGSGIVGLTLAAALKESSLRIAIIDRAAPTDTGLGNEYDLRVSAITCASQKIFSALGLWSAIATQRISPFRKIRVWDTKTASQLDFDSADVGAAELGYIIENSVIHKALYEQLRACPNIDFLFNAELQALQINSTEVLLAFETDQSRVGKAQDVHQPNTANINLTAKLVVGADGAESRVRTLANIDIKTHDYAHTALVATVRTAKPHQATAWQHFMPNGVLAFLPLSDPHTCSIVWSTQPAEATRLLAMNDTDFALELIKTFNYRLGDVVTLSKRLHFPLRMRHAKKYCLPRLALIGDAAHTIHPLAGQGVNLGILDAICLAETILAARKNKRAFDSITTLRRYERWRKGENLIMLAMVDGLKKLFADEGKLLTHMRSMGLNLTNNCMPIKNYFMQRAMGLTGDLPQLGRCHPAA